MSGIRLRSDRSLGLTLLLLAGAAAVFPQATPAAALR